MLIIQLGKSINCFLQLLLPLHIIKTGFHQNSHVRSGLTDCIVSVVWYFRCMESVRRNSKTDLVLWNTMISGHGRSVAVTCGLLVELGIAEDWKNAERIIREKRLCIRMNSLHHKSLEDWSQNRLSSSKRNKDGGVGVSSILLSSGHNLERPTTFLLLNLAS